jgi:hypothetical protein
MRNALQQPLLQHVLPPNPDTEEGYRGSRLGKAFVGPQVSMRMILEWERPRGVMDLTAEGWYANSQDRQADPSEGAEARTWGMAEPALFHDSS